jgi:hypothetical protein
LDDSLCGGPERHHPINLDSAADELIKVKVRRNPTRSEAAAPRLAFGCPLLQGPCLPVAPGQHGGKYYKHRNHGDGNQQ